MSGKIERYFWDAYFYISNDFNVLEYEVDANGVTIQELHWLCKKLGQEISNLEQEIAVEEAAYNLYYSLEVHEKIGEIRTTIIRKKEELHRKQLQHWITSMKLLELELSN